MILHPYVGYVLNPQYQKGINTLGFRGKLPEKKSSTYKVGIFGGSVAHMYAILESENLQKALAEKMQVPINNVEVYSFAIPGHKQPQQLMTLTYLYSLGYSFDLVVNIDGFNESVLSYVESYKQGVSPIYPRNWHIISRTFVSGRSLMYTRILLAVRNLQYTISQYSWGRNQAIQKVIGYLHYMLTSRLQNSLRAEQPQYQTNGPDIVSDKTNSKDVERVILNTWEQSSLQMHRTVLANGARYLEILHPNQYIPDSKPFSEEELKYYIKPNHPYAKPAREIYPILIQNAQTLLHEGVNMVDATKLFQHNPETLYADDCCHYNRKGYELLTQPIMNAFR